MKVFQVRIESGAVVAQYTIEAVDGFSARVKAHDRFNQEFPDRSVYGEITGFSEGITDYRSMTTDELICHAAYVKNELALELLRRMERELLEALEGQGK